MTAGIDREFWRMVRADVARDLADVVAQRLELEAELDALESGIKAVQASGYDVVMDSTSRPIRWTATYRREADDDAPDEP